MKKNTVLEDILSTLSRYFAVLVIAVVLLIGFSGVRFVKSGEVAVVLRFGKLVGNTYEEQIHEPGLFFAFPYVIDEVITIPVGTVMEKTITTHFTEGAMNETAEKNYLITGDQNIAVVAASVKYNVTDPVAYALQIKDADKILEAAVSNAMIESAAHRSVDGILSSEKDAFSIEVRQIAQATLDRVGSGVTIATFELTQVAMPEEVRSIYDEVNASTVRAQTMVQEAQQYRENLIPYSQSTQNSLIASANAKYAQAVSYAESDLAEYRGLLEEWQRDPTTLEAIKTRVYTDRMATLLARIRRVILVPEGETHIVVS